MCKVLFIRDFEGHKAGEVIDIIENLSYFQERDCIEVLEDIIPDPEPSVSSKPKKGKKIA